MVSKKVDADGARTHDLSIKGEAIQPVELLLNTVYILAQNLKEPTRSTDTNYFRNFGSKFF